MYSSFNTLLVITFIHNCFTSRQPQVYRILGRNNGIVLKKAYINHHPIDVAAVIKNSADLKYRAPADREPTGQETLNLESNKHKTYFKPLAEIPPSSSKIYKLKKVEKQSLSDLSDDSSISGKSDQDDFYQFSLDDFRGTTETKKRDRPPFVDTDEQEGAMYLRDIDVMVANLDAKKQPLVKKKIAAILKNLSDLHDDLVTELVATGPLKSRKKGFRPQYTFYNYWTYKKQLPPYICPGMQEVILGDLCIRIPEHRRRRRRRHTQD